MELQFQLDRPRHHSRTYQYLAAVGANLGMISIGMHYGWASTSLPILTSGNYSFQISNDEASWLASILPIGSGFGAFTSAFTSNVFGRKKIITFSALPLVISWLMIAIASSPGYMFVGKFLGGVIDGLMFTAVPSYLTEISDAEIRGLIGTTYAVIVVGGILTINILLYFLSIETAAYIAAVVSLPMLVIMPCLPDSAYFYLLKKDPEAAKASLQKYTGKDNVEEEFTRISEGIEKELENGGKFTELFTKSKNRRALIISCVLYFLQQFTGINVILAYCKSVFENSKNFLSPDTSNLIYFVVFFIVCTISLFLVDTAGRKVLLISSAVGTGLTLFGTGTFLFIHNETDVDLSKYEFVQLILLLLYILLYSIGLQTVPCLITSELFASNVKGLGLCLTNIIFSISVTTALKFFSWTTDTFGMHVPFFCFAVNTTIFVIFVILFVPETKGKTLEDVQSKLSKKKISLRN